MIFVFSTLRLLVGAPKAQTAQKNIQEAGGVFRCRTDRQECYIVPFDTAGNSFNNNTLEVEEDKSEEWFGASLETSGKNGVIVACAPRYMYFFGRDKREPIGRCIVKKPSSRMYETYAPCKKGNKWGFHQVGHCQAGMSASLTKNGVKLLIGSPGSYFWQGQIHDINLRSHKAISTKEGPLNNDDMYMGYATAVGEFNGDDIQDYVVSAPKADRHYGKVMIYTQELIHIQSILGQQFGEYFGSAIEAEDLNGDKLDDIIVGAPMHSIYEDVSFEVGCVYVYYQSSKHTFHQNNKDILVGKTIKGRFGWAFAKLKDINFDGYNDFATSAPYGGKDGKGAVYIYHGSVKGVKTEPAQVIDASNLKSSLRTFGYSLSGGMDLDGNGYTDLLVGSYAADKTAFFRARPVVSVQTELNLDPQLINLEQKTCRLLNGNPRTCMQIHTELRYGGINLPPKLRLEVKWTLDALNNKTHRVYYLEAGNEISKTQTFLLVKGEAKSVRHQAYLKENIRDKLTPVGVSLEYRIVQAAKRRKRELTPILNKYTSETKISTIQIQKDCGPDNICIPDLVLYVPRTSSQQIIGNRKNLEMQIKVENQKEDAFETQLFVTLPPDVTYVKIQDVKAKISVGCKAIVSGDVNVVVCDLGNPLKKKQKVSLTMKFSPKHVNGSNKFLDFQIQVNCSNKEEKQDIHNNFHNVSIPVKAAADIIILGKSTPDQVIYNSSQGDEIRESYMYNKTIAKHGPSVEHLYEMRNKGDSDVSKSILTIQWPSYDVKGNPLLELVGIPTVISGEGSCEVETTPHITQKKFQLSNTRKRRETEEKFLYTLNCTGKWCSNITCTLGYLKKGDNILVQVRSKLWTSTLLKMEYLDKHQILSKAKLVVTSIPYDLKWDPYDFPSATKELYTLVNPEKLVPKSRSIPIWVIAIAVAAGILLLFLLIVLLWWCGFFKRVKPEDMQELNGDTRQ
ncbi:integrin alpha-8-like isoform X3 [Octopus vulgaris]|uniref:Integrin alpha-8-like isoform X3 n=1 Tax=Octopus vulgaris TaxID=6645 RepID=A0AA36B655_OCTVU|nr:integrin alpha-8-like isoform X3 [Octopus vulgaris]